jgi:hypothetical protein
MAYPLHIGRGFFPAFAILLLAVAISGYANLTEMKAFAMLSSSAAKHEAVTRDYIAALDRRKQYQPLKYHAELEAQKARREAQQASLDVLQQSITDYMQGLGEVWQ